MRSKLRYRSPLSGQQIRLLTILPAISSDQPVKCLLRRVSLHEAPAYEALSYVWGDPTVKAEITCNGDIFIATVNLYHALVRLRLPNSVRLIWADAVCINQDDLDERARQVALMRQIYSRAKRVVVWLGRETRELASAASASLKIVAEACWEYEKKWSDSEDATLPDVGVAKGFMVYRAVDLPEEVYDELAWKALKVLYDRPWFERVWCIQEIRLSSDAICFWGDEEIPWSDIGMTAAWLRDIHDYSDFVPGTFPEEIEYRSAYFMYDSEWADNSLPETIVRFSGHQATDPRDKVYGIFGLLRPEEADAIVVNYRKKLSEVYADTTIAAIRMSSTLDVLAHVEHPPEYTGDDGFHSWAPRWELSRQMIPLTKEGRNSWMTWDDDPIEDLEKLEMRPGFLRLEGLIFSRVASVRVAMDEAVLRDLEEPSKPHPFLEWWNEVLQKYPPPSSGSTEGIYAAMAMSMTLTAGWDGTSKLVDPLEDPEARQKMFSNYVALIDHLFQMTGEENTTSYKPLSMAVHESDMEKFVNITWTICHGRRLFEMENGSYGIGPACMREGDVAVILPGGKCPYILREIDQSSRVFRYMGEAYIDKIMGDQHHLEDEDLRGGNIQLVEFFLD